LVVSFIFSGDLYRPPAAPYHPCHSFQQYIQSVQGGRAAGGLSAASFSYDKPRITDILSDSMIMYRLPMVANMNQGQYLAGYKGKIQTRIEC